MYADPEELEKFRAALERGIQHFDAGRYEQAYEVWEARWSEETTDGADLLQGLLQVAVALSKMEAGAGSAAVKLFDTALPKLALYSPEAHGLDVDEMSARVRYWRESAGASGGRTKAGS